MEISTRAAPHSLQPWPVALRAPLADVTAAPGGAPGAPRSGALAVGADGAVLRYEPGRGWQREFLLSSSGAVNKATLRGVAWPEPGAGLRGRRPRRDVAVERRRRPLDPRPGRADRLRGEPDGRRLRPRQPRPRLRGRQGRRAARATARAGTRSRCRPASKGRNLTSIAFAGSQAIVAAGGDLLVNDGGGWRVDPSAHALLDRVRAGNPQLYAVAGLPDGGAVAAGRDIVIERDGPGAPWRFSDQPIVGSTAIAAAAVRDGAEVRAVVSVVPRLAFPPADDLPEPDPNMPPPIAPPFSFPGDGYLLRETGAGWVDEQRTAFSSSGDDTPAEERPGPLAAARCRRQRLGGRRLERRRRFGRSWHLGPAAAAALFANGCGPR